MLRNVTGTTLAIINNINLVITTILNQSVKKRILVIGNMDSVW